MSGIRLLSGSGGMVVKMKITPWAALPPTLLPRPGSRPEAQQDAVVRDHVSLFTGAVAPAPLERGSLPRGMVEVGGGAVRYGPGAGALRSRLEERGVSLVGLRHGQTEMNARPAPVLCGQNETPLTPHGRAQAATAARQIFEELGGDDILSRPELLPVIYSSPLSRARDTAQALLDLVAERAAALGVEAPALPVVADERLLEIHFGSCEMSTVAEFRADRPEFARTWDSFDGEGVNFMERFPGGESRADVVNRVSSFLEDVARRHPRRTVVTVCHQETLVAARAALGLARTAEGKLRADAPTVLNATPMRLTRPPVPLYLTA